MTAKPFTPPPRPTITPYGDAAAPYGAAAALAAAVHHHEAGSLAEAEALYRRILAAQPDHGEALHLLGVLHLQAGDAEAAAASMRKAVAADRRNAAFHADLGVALMGAGRAAEGLASLRRAVKLEPGHAQAHYNIALALLRSGDEAGAAAAFRKAIRRQPGHAGAHMNLGLILAQQGKTETGLENLQRAVALSPGDVVARTNLGNVLVDAERPVDAVAHFEAALESAPDHAAAHFGLGNALEASVGTPPRRLVLDWAGRHFERAIAIELDFAEAHNNLGNVRKLQRRFDDAERHYRRAGALRPGSIEYTANLAEVLVDQDRDDEAMALFRSIRSADPEFVYALERIARLLQEKGAFGKARQIIDEMRTLAPNSAAVFQLLSTERDYRFSPEEIARMERQTLDEALPETERIRLAFALAHAFDRAASYDQAFAHLQRGNALVNAGYAYDREQTAAFVERSAAVFTPEFFAAREGFGGNDERPVLIVGMPRSGTTLVEQIISSHPRAAGGGELAEIPEIVDELEDGDPPYPKCIDRLDRSAAGDLARRYAGRLERVAPGAARVTDKMPVNFRHLGLIALLLPRARVVHCVRDPRDNCFSLYLLHLRAYHPYAYDLDNLVDYYRHHEALMDHWRRVTPLSIMRLRYEDLIADQEGKSRDIIAYCGLEWDDRCLRFFETERSVRTASLWQVRQPIYTSAVGRWRRYEKHLEALTEAFGSGDLGDE